MSLQEGRGRFIKYLRTIVQLSPWGESMKFVMEKVVSCDDFGPRYPFQTLPHSPSKSMPRINYFVPLYPIESVVTIETFLLIIYFCSCFFLKNFPSFAQCKQDWIGFCFPSLLFPSTDPSSLFPCTQSDDYNQLPSSLFFWVNE